MCSQSASRSPVAAIRAALLRLLQGQRRDATEARGERAGLRHQRVVRHDAGDETDGERAFGVDEVPREQHLQRGLRPDDRGQAQPAVGGRDERTLDVAGREPRALRRDAEVREHEHLDRVAHRDAAHRGDDGLREIAQAPPGQLERQRLAVLVLGRVLPAQDRDVVARRERRIGARQDQAADLGVVACAIQGRVQRPVAGDVHRVAPLGPVQRDRRDVALCRVEDGFGHDYRPRTCRATLLWWISSVPPAIVAARWPR